MTFLKSQQKTASESNAQETIKSSQKNVGTFLQGKSKQDKPQKRFRGVCAICGQPKAGRGKLCMDCYRKQRDSSKTFVCKYCGKTFTRKQYEIDKAHKNGFEINYCSRDCSCKAQAEAQRTNFCVICGKPVKRTRKKYCSDECEKIARENRKIPKTCAFCGKEFFANSSRRQYCSMECKNKAHSVNMMGMGNSHFTPSRSFNKEFADIRQQILDRDKHTCQKCGATEEVVCLKGGRSKTRTNLVVHHIDENPRNNEPSNLITLCGFCHLSLHHKKI